jgi:hypothetical protein
MQTSIVMSRLCQDTKIATALCGIGEEFKKQSNSPITNQWRGIKRCQLASIDDRWVGKNYPPKQAALANPYPAKATSQL